jgi:stearoyl-CoA desaturase (Delta-9 desaturase)
MSAPTTTREMITGSSLIWVLERLGWVHDVRWPDPVRLAAKRVDGDTADLR